MEFSLLGGVIEIVVPLPDGFGIRCNVLLMSIVHAFIFISSQVRPDISPIRIPVNNAINIVNAKVKMQENAEEILHVFDEKIY